MKLLSLDRAWSGQDPHWVLGRESEGHSVGVESVFKLSPPLPLSKSHQPFTQVKVIFR